MVPAKIRIPVTAALPRKRLETRLEQAWGHRLTLVLAPAGSGKTTVVAQLAAASGAPTGWYRAEAWDADASSFIGHLEAALAGALPDLRGGWRSVEDAARALEGITLERALLVLDDAHALEGTEAEAVLGRFVDYAPPWLAIVVASRVAPSINLSRLRVSGGLLELGPDDLRFRAWEVEELFRDVYRDPVPPADLAVLARRTEGWAAGLQLFHLATRGKPLEERRRMLGGAGSGGRMMREYLARNVMFELPAELRDFLLDTCVLGQLSGPLCDRLRDTSGSAAVLEELVRRGVFTVPVEDADDTYRYHEVLRQHLDRMLVEEVGEQEARERHARAGALLEQAGAPSEALRAYCRAEDWGAVQRLLGRQGESLASSSGSWLGVVPAAIERHDPWVALASARQARSEGRWSAAIEAYLRAETGFGAAAAADAPRRERLALAAWLDPAAMAPHDATGLLRAGLVREPATAAREVAGVQDAASPLVRGLLLLAAGEVHDAHRALVSAAEAGQGGPALTAAATLGALVAAGLAGDQVAPAAVDAAVEAAERAGAAWLARLGRGLRPWIAGTDGMAPGRGVARSPDEPWAAALVELACAWSAVRIVAGEAPGAGSGTHERRLAAADRAAIAFRRLGAAVPEAWARGLSAFLLAEGGSADARDAAVSAESLGRLTGSRGPLVFAHGALASVERPGSGPARDHALLAEAVSTETGLATPAPSTPEPLRAYVGRTTGKVVVGSRDGGEDGRTLRAARPVEGDAGRRAVYVRTLGGFALEVGGRRVPVDGAKPRVKALLRLLALHAGAPVHREVIQDALWPDAGSVAGARSLHVAISAVRRLLDEVAQPIGGQLVVRDGDAYRLDLPPEAIDIALLDRALGKGRAARGRREGASVPFGEVLDLYAGELLPEDGPAEWVIERRDHYRAAAVEAALGLAEERLLAGDVTAAARACRAGLEADRYQDGLWRMLIESRERAGDTSAASRDRGEYRRILEALGVPDAALSPS